MNKILGPTLHGVLDYGLALVFVWAPGILGFTYTAANLSQMIGVVYLTLAIATRYPLGLLRVVPFPVHGVLESLMAASWIALPWLFGFASDAAARNFFVGVGAALLAAALATDYRANGLRSRPVDRRHSPFDRRQHERAVASERRLVGDRRRSAA